MQKKRVYEIAQELGIPSQELIAKLGELGVKVKSHMNTLSAEDASLAVEIFNEEKESNKKPEKSKPKNKKEIKTSAKKSNNNSKPNMDKEKQISSKKDNVNDAQISKSSGKDAAAKSEIEIDESVQVGDLAKLLNKQPSEIITKLMKKGIMANINQSIDFDTASEIASSFGIALKKAAGESQEDIVKQQLAEINPEDLVQRAPIVTVMGHVDHGKTSLLDKIRSTKVTAKEAGGITQHIGASEVVIDGKKIVFLDTPGHEAFTEMRARGAKVTDIAVLVVAGDDGIKPQTLEAIAHAKAANVPIIVAINKIDKPTSNVDRVKQELSENGVLVEDWGGDTIAVPVSAKTGENIDELLEMILLVAEMQELKANPDKPATGVTLEAKLDKAKGPVASFIITDGTLKVGDPVLVGTSYGRVRAMLNDKGKRLKKAGPATAVKILGLNEIPEAGEKFVVTKDEKTAKAIGESRKSKERAKMLKANSKVSLDDLFDRMQKGEIKELNIVIKADVQGSLEALRQSLEKLSNDEVRINIIHGGVGGIVESDIMLASASNAIVIGFNVRPSTGSLSIIEREKVDVRTYNIIYEIIEDITKAMKGMLEPEFKEVTLGNAEVRQVFKASGVGTIAGVYVINGKIKRNSNARLVRDGIVIYDGEISSLKRFKDDVKEVQNGYECGITLSNFNDIKEDDVIESYTNEEVER